jgi:hypothetical protein
MDHRHGVWRRHYHFKSPVAKSLVQPILKRFSLSPLQFQPKRSRLSSQEWVSILGRHPGSNRRIHFRNWNGVKTICHLLYLPDFSSADFFLFSQGQNRSCWPFAAQDSFKKSLYGVVQTIAKDEFADVIQPSIDGCKKCVNIGSD